MTLPFLEKASESAAAILSCMRQDLAYTAALCEQAGVVLLPYPFDAAFQVLMREWRNGAGYDFTVLCRALRASGADTNGASPDSIRPVLYAPQPLFSAPVHIRAVVEAEAARQLHHLGGELQSQANDILADVPRLLESARERLRGITLERPRPNLPVWRDGLDLACNKPPLPAELVQGILHRGAKLVLGGSSKSNKTWSLLDMALSVAGGHPWWGMPTVRGRVLYLNLEIADAFFARRIHAVLEAKDAGIEPGDLTVWGLRGHTCDIGYLTDQILPEIKAGNFSLIILDPIYKCLGDRDENKAGEIASLLNQIERIAVESNAAVAFGAHYSKGNQSAKESIDRIGGSGVFARDPDAILTLTKHEEDDAFTCEPILRNHPPCAPFVLRWEWPLMRRDDTLDPMALKQQGKGRTPAFGVEDLVEVLGKNDLDSGDFASKCLEEKGISRATFFRLLNEAKRQNKIRKSAISGGYINA